VSQQIFDLSGRTALVTGASRGLGQSMAIGLARAGAHVVITSRSLASLKQTQDEITQAGGSTHPLVLDVQDVPAMKHQLQTLEDEIGCPDILVNNAGYEEVCASVDVDEALWDKITGTNLKGAFFCSQAVAKGMIKAGKGGSIINVCSLTSYVGVPTAVPYGSSKSGLLGMTRALSVEWAKDNIRVNAIAPGYFRTDLTDQFYQDKDWQEAMLNKIPADRFGGKSDLEGVIVFLAGQSSGYITGQCIAVDGGFLASI